MSNEELERQIEAIRQKPLLILCRLPDKMELVMTVSECRQRGGVYLHVLADDLDGLLEAQLGTPPPFTMGRGAVSLTGLPHPKKTQAFAHAPPPRIFGEGIKKPRAIARRIISAITYR